MIASIIELRKIMDYNDAKRIASKLSQQKNHCLHKTKSVYMPVTRRGKEIDMLKFVNYYDLEKAVSFFLLKASKDTHAHVRRQLLKTAKELAKVVDELHKTTKND